MAETTAVSRVKLSEDVLFQELQGEGVLLEMTTGVYFGLDRVGTRTWQLLGESGVIADLVSVLIQEYDVSEERCESDVRTLVGELLQHRLLEVV